MSAVTYYYGAEFRQGRWAGVVYHWDATGNVQIYDTVIEPTDGNGSKEHAIDAAGEWADDHDIDAEGDF